MKPLVSIIVPAYNAADVIGETIQSVQAQSYANWEILITDDGSTDRTAEVVKAYAEKDPRVKLLQFEENTGLAARSRNNSMSKAAGEFMAFLDADDVWLPQKLEKQIACFAEHPEVDVTCGWYHVFGDEERVRLYKSMMWRFPAGRVTAEQILQQCMPTSTVMMRARCFHETGGMDESPQLRSGQDYEFFIRLVMKYRVHRLAEELAGYRLAAHGGSLSSARHQVEQRRQREQAIFDSIREKKLLTPKLLRRHEANMHYSLARDNLFQFHEPFRRDLWNSVKTLAAPPKANVMFALSFLPAPMLRAMLVGLLKLRHGAGA